MKKILAVLCVLAVIVSCKAVTNNSTKGNKKITSVEKSISDYTELLASGSCDIVYEQKPGAPYLRIETDENLQGDVKAEVKNGVLEISLPNIQPSQFKAYTNSAVLSKTRIGGSGSIFLKGEVKSTTLEIAIGGSGGVTAEKLQCDNLNISIGGSGSAKVKGNTTQSNITISGSGGVNAENMVTQSTTCTIKGSGGAKVYTTNKLTAKINGSGSIKYKGNPKKIDKTISGSGSVSSF